MSRQRNGNAIIGLVGDVFVERDDPYEAFAAITPELHAVDALFGNVEAPYTRTPHVSPNSPHPLHGDPKSLPAFGSAGFSLVSMANNHALCVGYEAMLSTRATLEDLGVAVGGVGDTLEDARRPRVIDAGGYRLALVAHASIFPFGYEARPDRPGIAPLRTRNHFEYPFQMYLPEWQPSVRSEEFVEDVEGLRASIATAREQADVVVTSFHWGDNFAPDPYHLTQHERRVARLAIDAGADVVVGHHPPNLRGVEWYKGRPIFYSLGRFVFDLGPAVWRKMGHDPQTLPEVDAEDDFDGVARRTGYPYTLAAPDTLLTAVAWCAISDGSVTEAGLLPCQVQADGAVHPVDPESAAGQRVLDYVRRACRAAKLPADLAPSDTRLGRYGTVQIVPVEDAA